MAKRCKADAFEVLLIDRQNHHQFQPLFYQVASAGLEPSSISFPFRKLFHGQKHVDFCLAEALEIVPSEKRLLTDAGSFYYDFLVIATGCKTNFFGNEELASHAFSMKTTQEAIEIRNHILLSFEELATKGFDGQEALQNIVITGAGPTGVELAGAFSEMKKYILPRDYPRLDFSRLTIFLLEGSPNTLNALSDEAKQASRRYLEELGVQVKTNVVVTKYDGETVTLNNGETIKSRNVIWAAGVTGNVIRGLSPDALVRNRYVVDRFNRVKGYDDIYAIGDIAYMVTPKYPQAHPQVANVAIHQARNLALNLYARVKSKALREYEYKDLGSMATVGKHKAVVDLPFLRFQGRLAWFTWMFLHLMLILKVKNKLIIFINWAWSYFTNDSSLRLILKPRKEPDSTGKVA
ncbi:MAG: NAD(P)/FAD-dependent oxidoreductase [Bacteroidia bacterium]|nr:NAD(P)/FAD-dependent oxidoreductase [Bacteroidia bacterium]